MKVTEDGFCKVHGKACFTLEQVKQIHADKKTGFYYQCPSCGHHHMTSRPKNDETKRQQWLKKGKRRRGAQLTDEYNREFAEFLQVFKPAPQPLPKPSEKPVVYNPVVRQKPTLVMPSISMEEARAQLKAAIATTDEWIERWVQLENEAFQLLQKKFHQHQRQRLEGRSRLISLAISSGHHIREEMLRALHLSERKDTQVPFLQKRVKMNREYIKRWEAQMQEYQRDLRLLACCQIPS